MLNERFPLLSDWQNTFMAWKRRLEYLFSVISEHIDALEELPEDWVAPTFQNSWVNFGGTFATAAYYKDAFGVVHLKGTVKDGTVGAAIFTLPTGYRPAAEQLFPVVSNSLFGAVNVSAAGAVSLSVGSNVYVSLDGIAFRT